MANRFRLSVSQIKILDTIAFLNEQSLFPSSLGVQKILSGVLDEETAPFEEFETFATLISFSSKKVSRSIGVLEKHGYIGQIYDQKTDDLYLRITENGKRSLDEYFSKHSREFPKKPCKIKRTIVRIEEPF